MTSAGIPTFGGEHMDPESCAPTAGTPLPSRPVRAEANSHGWCQHDVVASNADAGSTDMVGDRG